MAVEGFFNTAKYPTITFKSNKLVFEGDKVVAAEGDFTLLGVTKPVKLAVSNFKCGPNPMNKKEMCGADISTTIKRSDFGMTKYLPAHRRRDQDHLGGRSLQAVTRRTRVPATTVAGTPFRNIALPLMPLRIELRFPLLGARHVPCRTPLPCAGRHGRSRSHGGSAYRRRLAQLHSGRPARYRGQGSP